MAGARGGSRCRVPVKPRRAGGSSLVPASAQSSDRPSAAMQPLSAAIPPASIFSGLSHRPRRPQPGREASGRTLGSGSPAGEARSPLRGGAGPGGAQTSSFRPPLCRGTQACSLGGPCLETQTGRSRGSPLCFHQFFKILGSLEAALTQGCACSHAPLGVPWLLRSSGFVPLVAVIPPRPPLSRLMRRSGGCKMARLSVRGWVKGPPAPPGAPVFGWNKNSP